MLGHELRNPLAPILTALQLMRLRGVQGAERERVVIERQVEHLVGLVDDLLDVSRITRGKVQLRRRPMEIAEAVAKAIEMASPLLEQRQQDLRVKVAPAGLRIDGDLDRLAQVIANLLTNAAKYTEPGGRITVSGEVEGTDIVLKVRDTGIGIDPAMLPRIFDLFTQERQALDRSQGGLGLGLAIVHSIVVIHGGTVAAFSQGQGRGSEFVIRLPRVEAEAPLARQERLAQEALAYSPDSGLRVLVVDDNEDAALMMAELLRTSGHQPRTAHDGLAALAIAAEFKPHVGLLDIGLPVMDGYEVARRFRDDPALRGTRLVAVTGYGQEHDRQRSLEAGFAAHLVKPVDFDALTTLVSALGREAIAGGVEVE
jgi:CheY-like chemotaxis protein/anti-sigma regulatory factor (Ser/Thr protein kinase)